MRKWCRELEFCYKPRNKKLQVSKHQRFDVAVVPPACNFIKNKTPAQVLSFEFRKFPHSIYLLKTRLRHRCILVNFDKFFSLQLD